MADLLANYVCGAGDATRPKDDPWVPADVEHAEIEDRVVAARVPVGGVLEPVPGDHERSYRFQVFVGGSSWGGRNDAHDEIARIGLACRRRGLFLGHDPVFAARPPKRRSRLAYSAIALSSATLSKSGQWIGTKTSSL